MSGREGGEGMAVAGVEKDEERMEDGKDGNERAMLGFRLGRMTKENSQRNPATYEVIYGHVPGKDGLNSPLVPLLYIPVAGSMHCPPLPATP